MPAHPPILSGRYELRALLGRGGMSRVFRARDLVLDRAVAVKVLSPDLARRPGFTERFRREATAAGGLSHPGIVAVFDAGVDGGRHYLVMELVEGRTLDEILRDQAILPSPRALTLAAQAADALAAAHGAGLAHGDISSANLIVTPEGEVRLLDFGLAGAAREPEVGSEPAYGTRSTLAPERAEGAPPDPRSDVYSLGAVLYRMLTGRSANGAGPLVPPSRAGARVPTAVDAVVMRTLAAHPGNRYRDAGELAADLDRAIHGQAVEATPVLAWSPHDSGEPPISAPPEGRRRRPSALLVAEIAVAALVVGAVASARLAGLEPDEPGHRPTETPAVTSAPGSAAPGITPTAAPTPSPSVSALTPSPSPTATVEPSLSPQPTTPEPSPTGSSPSTLPIPTPSLTSPGPPP